MSFFTREKGLKIYRTIIATFLLAMSVTSVAVIILMGVLI